MRRHYRACMVALWLFVLCLPLTALVTIGLLPLWSWIETRYGVESVGHSGPAEWCYAAVYAGCVSLGGAGIIRTRVRARRE